jgi:hypothetical protein
MTAPSFSVLASEAVADHDKRADWECGDSGGDLTPAFGRLIVPMELELAA